MKKPIIIGVIAVIATIIVTNIVDFSVEAEQPNKQIRLQTSHSQNDGIISCPNNESIETSFSRMVFTEHDGLDSRGTFIQHDNPRTFSGDLWSGKIQADKFAFTGIGFTSTDLAQFCGTDAGEVFEMRIWGKCGQDVTIHFDSDLGYSGSFTSNVLCV
ncbi:MAG: hypothetical protein OEM79_05730 [Nitrosopumilus sp.]|nr:hypothetical protein [Nitrosopumilus sp.]